VLKAAGVSELVDVRSIPRSRRHPQFMRESLASSLPALGIDYRHEQALGGFRRPSPDSPNMGWDHPSFAGYADHMASSEFRLARDRLQAQARVRSTCVMCAEAQWWRCHRRLIADALVVRGWQVLHLGLDVGPIEHQLTSFAVVAKDGMLSYPPAQARLV
jgi:uncharacterized protein (DUF488 family)